MADVRTKVRAPAGWAVTEAPSSSTGPGQYGHPAAGAGFGLPQSTSYRYVAEARQVIAARAPGLEEALQQAVREGTPYVILDGKERQPGASLQDLRGRLRLGGRAGPARHRRSTPRQGTRRQP
jgi:hypothetical protein